MHIEVNYAAMTGMSTNRSFLSQGREVHKMEESTTKHIGEMQYL